MTRVIAMAVALLLLARPASAQSPLDDVIDSLTSLWARADGSAIAALTIDDGAEFEVEGQSLGTLSGRNMAAALRRVFEDRETIAVRSSAASTVAGTDDRAFGELVWEVRPPGGTVVERSTIFLGLTRVRDGWRVSQIRIFP